MYRYDKPSHRVYMTFFLRQGWCVQFLEADLRTPLPRTFTFANPKKICELAQHGKATPEVVEEPERGIANGRGGCYLTLIAAQYARLTRP
jgi:hypothetical protein